MYERSRHSPEEKVVDDSTDFAYDVYDSDCLYDPSTDYCYEPLVNFPSDRECAETCEDTLVVNGTTYIPKRCYRDGSRLKTELESQGFDVILQHGEWGEDSISVHGGSGIILESANT